MVTARIHQSNLNQGETTMNETCTYCGEENDIASFAGDISVCFDCAALAEPVEPPE